MIKNARNVDRTTNSSILEQHSCFCDIFQNSTLCYRVREVKHRKFIYFDFCLTRFFNIVSSLFCLLVCLVVSFWFFSLYLISEISVFGFLHGIFDLSRLIIKQFFFSEVFGLIPKQMFLKMRSFDFSNDAFNLQNLSIWFL